jgi:uncharacterized protein (DUF885 family)
MVIMKTVCYYPLIFLLLAAGCAGKKITVSQDKEFESYRDRFMDAYWEQMPGSAVNAGNHKYDSILQIPGKETYAQILGFCSSHSDSLKNFHDSLLSDQLRIDKWMIRDQLQFLSWHLTSFKGYEWNPAAWNIAGECAEILNGNYAPLDQRLKALSARLQNAEAYYKSARENIIKPTREHTALAILQHNGAADEVFGKAVLDSVNVSGLSEEEKIILKQRISAANAAMKSYASWLSDLEKNFTDANTRSFRIGKSLYANKFDYEIVSSYSADEIHRKALTRRSEIHGEMAAISRELWPKYFGKSPMPADSLKLIRRIIDTLSVKHVEPDSFLQAVEAQIPELEKFTREKDLLYLDPSKPLKVRKTPGYMEGSGAGASISAPGPFDKGGNTYYNVSPLTGYTPEEAESYLREYNHYILQILNIHEAIPGHYAQLVYSNKSPSLVKSIFGNGAMVEGWAVYSERVMLENGYGNHEPEMWLMYYKWHLRSVCNTILDYSVHVLNMSEEDAKKLLIDGAFQQQAEADGKWRRVKLSSVQLCSYFTGYTEIYDLRKEMMDRKGKNFSLREFHEQFLSFGSAPVKYIRDLMLNSKN